MIGRFLFLMVPILQACTSSSEKYGKIYFDFDSLINRQVLELQKANVTLQKKAELNTKADSVSMVSDSLTLANELDIFRQLDVINKPVYRNMFEVSDREKDTRSNLWMRSYRAKKESVVPYVKFYYQSVPWHLKKIEAVYQEKNALFYSQRFLQMEFDDATGLPILSNYRLTGVQKMILTDSVRFSVGVKFIPKEE
jgi:hypothetical protein